MTDTTAPHQRAGLAVPTDWAILVALAVAGALLRYAAYYLAIEPGSFADFVTSLCRWDCDHYEAVSQGYDLPPDWTRVGGTNWAFFPLYPLLVRALQTLTGLDWAHAGFLLSNVFGIAAAGLARPLVRGGERTYWLFVTGLLLGPFSYFFSMPYTESLFILLTILTLRALDRGQYNTAGAWGALLSATRVTGVLIGLSLVVQAVADRLAEGTRWTRLPAALLADRRLLLGCLLVPLGLIAFMLHLRLAMGDGLAFAHVQIAWARELRSPLANWWEVFSTTWPFTSHFGTPSNNAWILTIAVGLSIGLAATRRWAAAVFCLAVLALSASTGLISMVRFVAGLAPLGILLAEILGRNRWVAYAAFPFAVLSGLALTIAWLLDWTLLV